MTLWYEFNRIISEWNTVSIGMRLICSMFIGVIIGIDREYKNRGAGIKTHVLVCLGSTLVMMVGEYIAFQFPDSKVDITRIGAQVVSGVGFLGVGTIIVTGKNQVKGLTTAAGLWVCACTGLAVGIGFVQGAILTVLLIIFTLKGLSFLERVMHKYKKRFDMYIEFESNKSIKIFISKMRERKVKISNMNFVKESLKDDGPMAIVTCEISKIREREEFLEILREMNGIKYLEEL